MKSIVPASLRIAFWSLIGRMWDEQAPTGPHVQRVVEIVQALLPGGSARILDVGCGAGVYSVAFAEAGYDVTGVDAAQGMLSRAEAKITPTLKSRLRFGEENLDKQLSMPASSFEGVVAISVLQAVQSPAHAVREVLRVLKPGGVFVVLHSLRPAYHDHSLWDQIHARVRILKRKTPWNMLLAAAKIMAERSNASLYWSVEELHALLRSQGFQIESTPETNPIIVVARRPTTLQSDVKAIIEVGGSRPPNNRMQLTWLTGAPGRAAPVHQCACGRSGLGSPATQLMRAVSHSLDQCDPSEISRDVARKADQI